MQIEILADADAVASRAAEFIAVEARAAVADRGRFTLALSGGRTPWQMLRALSALPMPWAAVHIFQVDERVAPAGDPDRNLTHIVESLRAARDRPAANLHPLPVNDGDLATAAERYGRQLETYTGAPPVLDLVHLGLGPDGHTASLVPGDPVLDATASVAITATYMGHRRLTLTYPVLDGARRVLWLVTGAEKVPMLARLRAGDRTIPAGRVDGARALILADHAAAGTSPAP